MGGLNGLTLDKIAKMTDYQLVNVYLAKLDGEEEQEDKPKGTPVSCYQQIYQLVHQRKFGLSLAEIREKWEKDVPQEAWNNDLVIEDQPNG